MPINERGFLGQDVERMRLEIVARYNVYLAFVDIMNDPDLKLLPSPYTLWSLPLQSEYLWPEVGPSEDDPTFHTHHGCHRHGGGVGALEEGVLASTCRLRSVNSLGGSKHLWRRPSGHKRAYRQYR